MAGLKSAYQISWHKLLDIFLVPQFADSYVFLSVQRLTKRLVRGCENVVLVLA